MDIPVVLLTSCSKYSTEDLVKGILDTDTLPEENVLIENISSYPWSIDTKYYTAEVQLCVPKGRTIGDQDFASCVEAFVVYFNPEEEKTFQQVTSWLPYLDQLDPDIKMLVCDRCTELTNVTRLVAQKWCIEHGFELVELNAEVLSDSETEDDFVETTGTKRIIQSLHAHPWPNLVLKDNRHTVSPYIRQLMKEEHDAKQANAIENDTDKKDTDDNLTEPEQNNSDLASDSDNKCVNGPDTLSKDCDKSVDVESVPSELTDNDFQEFKGAESTIGDTGPAGDSKDVKADSSKDNNVKQASREDRIDNLFQTDQALFEALGQEDPGGQSFEELFGKFASMKEKASALPPQDRKKYAETVAIAFWRAMGGDDDEVDDLDD